MMRIDESIMKDMWYITAGIFNMGNIGFKKEGDGFASIDPKGVKNMETMARLWGIETKAVKARLTTATMKVMKKNITKQVTFEQALTNRDSIAKGIYENLFLYLAERINAELYQTDEADIKRMLFIGILDVFGFENFWINSLEQFCINYTNEKLQQFFNHHIIRSEQEEYIKESVFWKPLTVPDNLEFTEFVEDKAKGFLTLLDSACKAPKPDPNALMQDIFKRHADNPCIKRIAKPGSGDARGRPKTADEQNQESLVSPVHMRPKDDKSRSATFDGFEIKHFAGADDVAYDISQFLTKHTMNSRHADTAQMMKKSEIALVKEIGGRGTSRRRRKKKTVTAVFANGIRTLIRNLHATEPYFVRCVNPNRQKSSSIWTESVVEHQLRCGGIVEALTVLKLGYPTRVPYSTLYDAYRSSAVTNPLLKCMKPVKFSSALLAAFDVSDADYELGLTRIFFKPNKAAVLDTIMAHAGKNLSAEQNAKITTFMIPELVFGYVRELQQAKIPDYLLFIIIDFVKRIGLR